MNNKKTIFYLDITSIEQLNRVDIPEGLKILKPKNINSIINTFFYREIGEIYRWHDRKNFTPKEWDQFLSLNKILTRIILFQENIAGYYELKPHPDGSVEILLFGILESFRALGIGKAALTEAIEEAYTLSSSNRAWVSTCSWDHEYALLNYQKRGMTIAKIEEKEDM